MNCQRCGGNLTAVGGTPTVWRCSDCTLSNIRNRNTPHEVEFVGDTTLTLEAM